MTIRLILILFVFALAGCEGSFSVSTAKLSQGQMAAAVDPQTKAPINAATTFPGDAPAIYVAAKLSSAPDGTKVKATFHYLEGGEREIASDEVMTGGERWVSFTLSSPASGWPAGQYEARLLLDGKEAQRLPFNVAPGGARAGLSAPAPAAPTMEPARATPAASPAERPAPSSAPGTKKIRDAKFGFEFELPASWTHKVTENKDYLFEGPKGTDAFELSIVLQFVSKAKNPGSSAEAQAQELLSQISGAPNAKVKTTEMLTIAGRQSPYFVATYTAQNSKKVSVPFAHTQIAMDHGAFYYLLSYSGPAQIYQNNLAVFQRVVETFRFIQ